MEGDSPAENVERRDAAGAVVERASFRDGVLHGPTTLFGREGLAEAEIGNDLGSLPEATRRRVLLEFLIENQLFADAAECAQLGSGAAFNERLQYWRRRALRDAYFDKNVRSAINDADAKNYYAGQIGTMKPGGLAATVRAMNAASGSVPASTTSTKPKLVRQPVSVPRQACR